MASKYESLLEVTLNVWFITLCLQEAQLPQRNSASAAHMDGGGGGLALQPTPPLPPLVVPERMVESESHNVRTHFKMNQAFKVIHIGAGRNPERCNVVMCN